MSLFCSYVIYSSSVIKYLINYVKEFVCILPSLYCIFKMKFSNCTYIVTSEMPQLKWSVNSIRLS